MATDVCGYLVEQISGEPFEEYLRRHLFEPLGMEDTGFHVPDEKLDRFAACYWRGARGGKELLLWDDPETSGYREPPVYVGGGGGLVSTAADYLRFCRMLVQGGELDGTRILGPRTIDWMTRNHLPGGRPLSELSRSLFSEVATAGMGFGLGFSVVDDPVRAGLPASRGTYAWGGAASTIFWIDPVEELIVIFLTQFFPSQVFNFRGQLQSIVYPAILE